MKGKLPLSTGDTAIVGMACRVAGAKDPSRLWENIVNKVDLRREIPNDRFNIDRFYHPNGQHKGTTSVRYGYFIDQPIDAFDHTFFGISGKEAEAMDPQQRLILEVVYEALEDAGITLDEISGTQTSVFVGTFTNDYAQMTARDMEFYPRYAVNGTSNAILANRVSFFYNLRGASVNLDTACSASLVGFHLGNESLLHGESDYCIVVGSALHFIPNTWQIMTDLGLLSADGRCRAFDAKGSGYVRGEGVCAVVLKRLKDAQSTGDNIRAVVRATGTNHDGTKSAIGLPSSESQERLLRDTYRKAGLHPDGTQLFEAHGTGTKAGDPREARAIGAVFATPTRDRPLWLGSVKTNIGHLEGAAGLIGVIKAVLAIEKRRIPPNMLFEDPHPDIPFTEWKLSVPTSEVEWAVEAGQLRRASVNSFGYGGANAHVILEEAPISNSPPNGAIPQDMENKTKRPYLVPIFAHSEIAGQNTARNIAKWSNDHPIIHPQELAFALAHKRSNHKYRSFVVGHSIEEIAEKLSYIGGQPSWSSAAPSPRIHFIFTGQGAQSSQMGEQLYNTSPVFRESLQKAESILQTLPDAPAWSLTKELLKPEPQSNLSKSEYSQPVCTALQLAIVDLLSSWGISPNAVCGHSSGEIAAAYASGFVTFESAIIIAYYRGLHMGKGVSRAGGMLAVGLGEVDAMRYLKDFSGRLVVAAFNSPKSVTISGDDDAIESLQQILLDQEVFVRRLKVEQAFHSHHMVPLAPAYQKSLEGGAFRPGPLLPTRGFYSSVTGSVIQEAGCLDASYWTQNMVQPVRFADALIELLSNSGDKPGEQATILLEIGPHPALRGPVRQILASLSTTASYVATLDRSRPSLESLLSGVGEIFCKGFEVNLGAVNDVNKGLGGSEFLPVTRLPGFPTYAWDHQKSWSQTRLIQNHLHHGTRHTLLGVTTPGSISSSPRWRNYLRLSEIPWLNEHVFDGKALFPGAGYITMAIEAIIRADEEANRGNISVISLKEIQIKAPLSLAESELGTDVYTELHRMRVSSRTVSDDWYEFSISSYNEDGRFAENCNGLISLTYGGDKNLEPQFKRRNLHESVRNATRRIKTKPLYNQISSNGLFLGERFALTKDQIYSGPGYVIAPTIIFDPSQYTSHEQSEGTLIHPTILDNCFQSLFTGIEGKLNSRLETVFVPTFIQELRVSGLMDSLSRTSPTHFSLATDIDMTNSRTAVANVHLQNKDDAASIVLEIKGLEMTAMGDTGGRTGKRRLFFQQRWQPSFETLSRTTAPAFIQSIEDALEIYQFQHPDARVLLLLPMEKAPEGILSAITNIANNHGGFATIHLHVEASNIEHTADSGLEATISRSALVQEPEGLYDLIISLRPTIDWAGLTPWSASSGTVMTAHHIKDNEVWERLVSFSQGAVFRHFEKRSVTNHNLIIVTSASQGARETGLVGAFRNRAGVIKVVSLQELPSFADQATLSYVVTAGLTYGSDHWNAGDWSGVRHLLGMQHVEIVWLLDGASLNNAAPKHALEAGLLHVARNENPSSCFTTLGIDRNAEYLSIVDTTLQILSADGREEEMAQCNGALYVPRVFEDANLNSQLYNGVGSGPRVQRFDSETALSLEIGTIGLLETLKFCPDSEIIGQPLGGDDVEIRVMASALNFRDIAATMGIIQDEKLGDECAGIVHRIGSNVDAQKFRPGDRVLACRPGQGAHRTFVRQPAALCVKIPDSFSFTVAASWSGVLTTAFYALNDVARLQHGETILIHSGSGGVGQMAIQLAQRIGAHILTTCSESKRGFLQQQFGLSETQIFSSRDESFVKGVMNATNGRGVDVVLNSLAGKLLTASWDCIAPLGRFVEIGKRDIHQNSVLPMAPFRRNVTFASIDLVLIYETQPKLAQRILEASAELIHSGEIKPASPIVEYSYAEVEKAMRLMQQGKHMGKVVLVPHPEDKVPVTPRRSDNIPLFDDQKIYLIVGGLGGLGALLAEWMVRRGCRHIASFSRSGDTKETAEDTVRWLRGKGVEVQVHMGDVTVRSHVEKCIRSLSTKLGGIFFAPMVLEDSLICNMTFRQWVDGIAVKFRGAENLHEVALDESLDLECFVAFSSTSAITGNKGQANYAAANAYVDALMHYRETQGLPGLAINLGAVTGSGIVEETNGLLKSLQRMKHDTINEHELLAQLDHAMRLSLEFRRRQERPSTTTVKTHKLITGINVSEADVFWAQRSRFRNLYANRDYAGSHASSRAKEGLAAILASAESLQERHRLLQDGLMDKVSVVMGIPRENIHGNQPLSAYGLDSIVAVELRKWLQEVAEVEVSLFDVMNTSSIEALVAIGLEGRG